MKINSRFCTLVVTVLCSLTSINTSAQVCECVPYCELTECSCGVLDTCFCECVGCPTPIIINVSRGDIVLTDVANGVLFDINADGLPEQIAWTKANSQVGFLVLDRNGDGVINNGTELFGNVTPQPSSKTPNGFRALSEFDKPENGGNGDGVIDSHDAVFPRLLLWIDANHNGISEPAELHPFSEFGITSISLDYRQSQRTDEFGNIFRYRSKVIIGGHSTWAYDVLLMSKPPGSTR